MKRTGFAALIHFGFEDGLPVVHEIEETAAHILPLLLRCSQPHLIFLWCTAQKRSVCGGRNQHASTHRRKHEPIKSCGISNRYLAVELMLPKSSRG